MLPFCVLSRRNLSYPSCRSSLNPRPVNLLQPLWALFAAPVLCFQQLAASFCKTPGMGVPLRDGRCIEAQKCLFVSPLFATLTYSVSRKSFPCHSYANTREGGATRPSPNLEHLTSNLCFYRYMRHVAPLSPVPSLDCAYLPSPRGGVPTTRFRFPCTCGKPNWLALCFHTLTNLFSRNSLMLTSIQSTGMAVALRGRPQRA